MSECQPCLVVQIPGPPGATGPAGTDGTDGISAVTTVTAQFTMPAEGANVSVSMAETGWLAPGQFVFLGKAGSAAKGTFQVSSITNSTTAILTNAANTASSLYTGNSAPGTIFPISTLVVAAGQQGATGPAAGGALLAANNLSDLANNTTARLNLGLGLLAELDTINNSDWFGAALAVANGGTGATTAAGARTNLSAQEADALLAAIAALVTVADRMIYTTGVDTVALTTLTSFARTLLDDPDAATMRSTLGVSGSGLSYLLYQDQRASGTDAGTFTTPGWQTVPLNTEVADQGGHGSIGANMVTLAQGTYRARWRMIGHRVDEFQSRLFNVTTTSVIGLGSNARSAATDTSAAYSDGEARFTVAAATEQVRIEAQSTATQGGDGFGVACGFGNNEVYASLELLKES